MRLAFRYSLDSNCSEGGSGTTEGSLRDRPMKDSALIYSPQGANGRRENVGQPRPAVFHRREENSGAEAAAAAAAEHRRLQRLAVVSLHRAEGSCSNTAYINRKTDLNTISTPHPPNLILCQCTLHETARHHYSDGICSCLSVRAVCPTSCSNKR